MQERETVTESGMLILVNFLVFETHEWWTSAAMMVWLPGLGWHKCMSSPWASRSAEEKLEGPSVS